MHTVEKEAQQKPLASVRWYMPVDRETALQYLLRECRKDKQFCKYGSDGYELFYVLEGVYYSVTSGLIARRQRFEVTVGELHKTNYVKPVL